MRESQSQPTSHKWATRLTLDAIGLKIAKSIFAPPSAIEVQELNLGDMAVPAIMSSDLDAAASWNEAFDVGQRMIMTVSAILFTRDPRRHAPSLEVQEIYQRRPDGGWDTQQSARPSGSGRAARSRMFQRPGEAEPSVQTKPIKGSLLAVAQTDEVVDVLHTLRGNPDWFDLWKATEPVERDWENLPKVVQTAENRAELDRFRASSTFHRHSPASEHWKTAGKTLTKLGAAQMNIVEASRAVAHLVGLWLAWKADVYGRKRSSSKPH